MRRRRLLAALGATGSLLAGCIGSPDESPGGPGSGGDGTTPGNTTPGTTTATDGTPTDGDRSLSVERVETFGYAIRINDLGEGPTGSVPGLADLDEREREVVAAAIDGGHETDDLPDWLVEFLSGTRFVTRHGDYHRLDADLPTYVVTAEETTEADVDGEIASNEAYREAVTHDGVVTTGVLRAARRDGYRTTDPWATLREFLDSYDAVRFRGDLLAVSATLDDPGPPYVVTAEPVDPADVVRGPVWNVEDADPAVREVLREAGETSGLQPVEDPPAGLIEGLDAHDRVYLDGRFYTTYVEKRNPLPVSMDATVPDADLADDGARLRLAVRNDGDGPVGVFAGAPMPFGVLGYHPAGEPDDRTTLWTDAYEDSQYVMVEDGEVSGVLDIGLSVDVAPGGEAARTFAVRETDLPAGEYVVEDSVGVEVPDGEGGSFPFRVVLRVE